MDLIALRELDSGPLLESFRVISGDPVTLRKLPAGDYREGSLHDEEGSLLRIRLGPGSLEPAAWNPVKPSRNSSQPIWWRLRAPKRSASARCRAGKASF